MTSKIFITLVIFLSFSVFTHAQEDSNFETYTITEQAMLVIEDEQGNYLIRAFIPVGEAELHIDANDVIELDYSYYVRVVWNNLEGYLSVDVIDGLSLEGLPKRLQSGHQIRAFSGSVNVRALPDAEATRVGAIGSDEGLYALHQDTIERLGELFDDVVFNAHPDYPIVIILNDETLDASSTVWIPILLNDSVTSVDTLETDDIAFVALRFNNTNLSVIDGIESMIVGMDRRPEVILEALGVPEQIDFIAPMIWDGRTGTVRVPATRTSVSVNLDSVLFNQSGEVISTGFLGFPEINDLDLNSATYERWISDFLALINPDQSPVAVVSGVVLSIHNHANGFQNMLIGLKGPDGQQTQLLVGRSILFFLDAVDRTGNPIHPTRSSATLVRGAADNSSLYTAPSGVTLRPGDVGIFLITVTDEVGAPSTLQNEQDLMAQLFRPYDPDRLSSSHGGRLLGILKG